MKKLLAVLALFLAGCAGVTPQTPAQMVYAVQGGYASALSVAVAYKNLPACGLPTSPVLCSDRATVKRIQDADNTAYAAITAAQNIVRSPNAGANADTAILAAQQAVAVLTQITSILKVNP